MRILLLIAIGLMVYIIFNRLLHSVGKTGHKKSIETPNDLVRCQYCHVHVLKQEAVGHDDNIYYCCIEHQALDKMG